MDRVMSSKKQQMILNFIAKNGEIRTCEAVIMVGFDIYCNHDKHVGAILQRMVKNGMIIRKSRGIYSMPDEKKGSLL